MDNNLDLFHLFDHSLDLEQKIKNAGGDYGKALKQFLESEREIEFRFNGTEYCEKHRFKNFIIEEISKFKKGELKSFEERAKDIYGPIEMYDNFEKDYLLNLEPAVFKYSRS